MNQTSELPEQCPRCGSKFNELDKEFEMCLSCLWKPFKVVKL